MYMAVSETAKSHGKSGSISRTGRKTAAILLAVLALTAGAGTVNLAAATDNTSGSGNGVAFGAGSSAPKAENVAIGKGATIKYSNGESKSTGDVVVGSGAVIDNYASQGGSIAIGNNVSIENMAGQQEQAFGFRQTTFTPKYDPDYWYGLVPVAQIPDDPTRVPGSIAIGQNSYARTGGLTIGIHNYQGKLGDVTINTSNEKDVNVKSKNVFETTLGTNSFNAGAFSTVMGAYSIASGNYEGGNNTSAATKNFGATITGSLNSIESATSSSKYSGIANSIVGTANRTSNSNGSLIFGAGNEVKNSITSIYAPSSGGDSAKTLQDNLMKAVKKSESGGATLVIGGGNTADYTQKTQILGVKNTVTGTEDNISMYNMIDGFNNTVNGASHLYTIGTNNTITNAKNTILFGDNRKAEGVENSVIIGNADEKTPITTEKKDTVILGHNANATADGGVALGAESVASVDKDAVGYDPANGDHQTDTTGTWKSTAAAVSVGDASKHITRQITNVAAGTQDTDAVNVAQLKNALSGAKDHNDTLQADQNALKLEGNTLSMSVKDTAGNEVSGSVDLSKFAQAVDTNTTYTLTGEANPDNNTTTITLSDNSGNKNGVTVATKDTRNTVKAGENVTLDTKDNADGSHEYTVNVKADGKVEAGSTKIVSGGTVYNETRVQKDGTYVKASNTAGENLTALDSQVASNAGAVNELNGRVNRLDSRINKVGAGAAALAALHPLDFNPDDKWDFAVGYGNYRNANSVALGAFYRPNENTMLSLGTNFGNGENMFNAGVSFKIGKGNSYAGYSKVEMAKVIDTQSREVAALKEENAKNAKDNAVMKAEIEALKKQVEALAAKK